MPGLVAWAKENGLGVVDLGGDGDTAGAAVTEAGLKIGSVDLRAWSGLITADETKREAAIAENNTYIAAAAAVGAKNFFTVLLPDDVVRSRRENLALAIEGKPCLGANGLKLDARQMSQLGHESRTQRGSAEGREGLAAFREKRRPAWYQPPTSG